MTDPNRPADPHEPADERDELELYHLGLLDDAARADLERRHQGAAALATSLGLGAPVAQPPEGARERLLAKARIDAKDEAPADEQRSPPLTFLARQEHRFGPSGIPGIEVAVLSRDAELGTSTVLLRFEPGASYPTHTHHGVEECIVLEGDVQVGDRTMGAGDFQRAEAGSHHPLHTSRSGCLLFIVSRGLDIDGA